MSVSSVSVSPTILTPTVQRAQSAQVSPSSGDNDGDSDDFGGPPDVDGASSGRLLDIKA